MLGGEIEATVQLNSCVFALTDSYDGKTATGSNRVASVSYSGEQNYLFFGGNSNVGTINWEIGSGTMLHLAQCSDISGDAGVFTTLRNVDSEYSTCNLITNSFTSDTLPTGFTIMANPDEDLFGFDSDNWFWYYQEEFGASIPFEMG